MRKLIWQNSLGDEINLTKAPFGITNWEGFSNAPLNIQSQQVPMQDGSVFLDALIENRDLSVTLSICDNNDLEKRYELERQLIHILNPKLGEGYLIYINDFISKRIKCIPQIPLFPNKNSNDPGTQKGELAWTACEPYWEDLEETSIIMKKGIQQIIKNNGDIPIQLKMDWYTSYVKNGSVTNLTQNQRIKYNGNLNSFLKINTNVGKKQVVNEQIEYVLSGLSGVDINSCVYSKDLNLFVAIGSHGEIITSVDNVHWEYQSSGTTQKLNSITYSSDLQLFVIVGKYGLIITSTNGKDWTTRRSGVTTDINFVYTPSRIFEFIAVGNAGVILTSNDGINWITQSSGVSVNLNSIFYSAEKNIFVAVGTSGIIITSTNGTTWTQRNSGVVYELKSIIYSSELQLFVAVGGSGINGVIIVSNDYINWESKINPARRRLNSIIYAAELNIFIGVGEDACFVISTDGENWSKQNYTIINDFNNVIYVSDFGVFVLVGNNGYLSYSYDYENWENSLFRANYPITSVAYSKDLNLFVGVGDYTISTSNNGKQWNVMNTNYNLLSITYSEDLGLFVATGRRGVIITSFDGLNWTQRHISEYDIYILSVIYCSDLGKFVAVGIKEQGGAIFISSDGISWTEISMSYSLYDLTYSSDLQLFVAVGNQVIITSANGTDWTLQSSGVTGYFDSIMYSTVSKTFVITVQNESYILKSKNGVDWIIVSTYPYYIGKIFYLSEFNMYIALKNGSIQISTDLINWTEKIIGENLYSLVYSSDLDILVIVGSTTLYSVLIDIENQIQNLSIDSNMNMTLQIGNNVYAINYDDGFMSVKLSYRQKYIGV